VIIVVRERVHLSIIYEIGTSFFSPWIPPKRRTQKWLILDIVLREEQTKLLIWGPDIRRNMFFFRQWLLNVHVPLAVISSYVPVYGGNILCGMDLQVPKIKMGYMKINHYFKTFHFLTSCSFGALYAKFKFGVGHKTKIPIIFWQSNIETYLAYRINKYIWLQTAYVL